MKLRTTLNGVSYSFKDINDVLAKANEPKSADRLQGIAAADETERVAAKVVLSELTVGDIVEHPAVPAAKDEVTRTELDGMNKRTYETLKNLTIGEFRNVVLSDKTDCPKIQWMSRGIIGEVAAATAKLMSAMDLVYAGSKIYKITKCRTEIGQPGTLSYRCQTNSPTDDPEEILLGVMEGLTYGCGDACIGINPVDDGLESVARLLKMMDEFRNKWEVPAQICVLAHITTQIEAAKRFNAPIDCVFQSIAGSQKGNESFGVTPQMLQDGRDYATTLGRADGPNLNYFETGQGSELSADAHNGWDQVVMESRCYGLAKHYDPFLLNTVVGFIGPEYLYDSKQVIRAGLEDHFMGKLQGIPMGCDACYTNHMKADQNDIELLTTCLVAAGANYIMGVPEGDDCMLMYQCTGFHESPAVREIFGLRPAKEFDQWLERMGFSKDGLLTERAGDASVFFGDPKDIMLW